MSRGNSNPDFIKGNNRSNLFDISVIPNNPPLPPKSKEESVIPSDSLDPIKRRVAIASNAYGSHNIDQISLFAGISKEQVKNIIKEFDAGQSVTCWTKAELISKLCIEAETAPAARDRITALTKLMEFRGLEEPTTSQVFNSIAMQFISKADEKQSFGTTHE